jgi:crotonobetainyl-CoA:carnitine CoA-transferase CaiB-like acyl-CoA transferase
VARAADPLTPDERAAWAGSRSAPDAAAELLAQGIAAAAMVPAFAVLDDPQLRARRFFEPVAHPVAGEHEYPTWPMRFSSGPERYLRSPAPLLGQHNDEVLRELGCSDEEIARLRAAHVIGEQPLT